MKILLACVHFHSSFGWSIERALQRAGHTVTVFEYRRAPGETFLRGLSRAWWKQAMPARLLALAASLRPDLLFIAKGETIPGEWVARIRRSCGCRTVNWFPDARLFSYPQVLSQLPHLDLVCSKNRPDLDRLQLLGLRNGHFLNHAADLELHLDHVASEQDLAPYRCQVGFIGSWYPYREALLAPLAEHFELKIWGGGWNETPLARRRPSCIAGREARSFEQTRIFRAATVHLNPHHFDDLGSLNQRVFDIAGSGGCQLLDGDRETGPVFGDTTMIDSFRSAEQLQEKLRARLEHPDRTREAAPQLQQHIRSKHTYDHRVREILDRLT